MRAVVAGFVLSGFLISISCRRPELGPHKEELQTLVGKTVREVAAALHVPESSLRASDEPPGIFRLVEGFWQESPFDRRLTIYVGREAAVIRIDGGKVLPSDLFDKTVVGIAVWFPMEDKRPDLVVGDVIWRYHRR